MEPTLQTFAQQIVNCHAANTVEQKLAFLKSAREYVTVYAPPIDALCLNTVFNLPVFGHLVLFQELLLLIETILSSQQRVELILPVFDFIERIGHGCSDDWISLVLHMCGRLYAIILPHTLNGRATTLAASWRLCWQKMSCLGQSLGVKALTSTCEELQLAGIAFMETLILLYTEPATLAAAGSGRGAPTADMFLFNCRYLLDQLTDQLGSTGPSGKSPVALVHCLADIVSRREKYFDSLVPHLLRQTEKSGFRLTHPLSTPVPVEPSSDVQLASALKKALLSLLGCRISNRQKSMLLLGLSQLGAVTDPLGFNRAIAAEQTPISTSWNYVSEGSAETPLPKRQRFETGTSDPAIEDYPSPSSNQEVAQGLVERAKSVFLGKLGVDELQKVLIILNRNGHADCVESIIKDLDPNLVIELVIHGFAHSAMLHVPKDKSAAPRWETEKPKSALSEMKGKDTIMEGLDEHGMVLQQHVVLGIGERQMLIEHSSNQLLKNESRRDASSLPLGMQFLSKLASRSPMSNIPLHTLTEFIAQKVHLRPESVRELSVQFLFDLFAAQGSSECEVPDVRVFLEAMATFDPAQLEHPYDQALHKILRKIAASEVDGRDKLLKGVLLEVPALPPAVVFDLFQRMLKEASSSAMSFLITANALMESRPVLRPVLLETVLDTCVSDDGDIREKAIRLVKNKLHQDEDLAERIEAFAADGLQTLVPLEPSPAEVGISGGKYCHLYLALCTRKAALLQKLMAVFAEASEAGKQVLSENAKQLSEAVMFLLPELLLLIKSVPKDAEPLLLLLLSIFPDKSPPQRVVDACIERHSETKNVRFLVPILPGLPKKRVMELIPLLTELSLTEFAAAVTDLVGQLPFGDSTVEPSEVLVALSTFSDAQSNSERLNAVRGALDFCIKQMSSVFDKEVLAGALNKLVHMHTLPVLFMRMVLLSVSREKDLGAFVLHSVLSVSVISSKIRPDNVQWPGYVMLLQRMMPASFRHLLTLPTRLMTAALRDMPKSFSERFVEFVESDACDVRASREALAALKDFVQNFEEAAGSDPTPAGDALQSGPETAGADRREEPQKSGPMDVEAVVEGNDAGGGESDSSALRRRGND